ncbi:hypothetical protein P7H20_18685 [Paenibacillus larvae]|nr:hypothetical protein [Paenibacillus larvae]MDT2276443.1 hypothetical protein [Paenibacillus larvae]
MSPKAKVSGSEKIAAVEEMYLRGKIRLIIWQHFLMYTIHRVGNGFRLTSR